MKRTILLFLIPILLSSCASLPKNAPSYSPAPIAAGDLGTLYIYRIGAYPTKRAPMILIDGEKLFSPPENAYTWIHLEEGTHIVKLDWAWDTGWPDLTFEIPIESNKDHFLKITGSFENLGKKFKMGSEIQFIEKSRAEQELIDYCKYITPITQ